MVKLNLRQIRERRLLTQGELAERVGMSRAAINRIEQGGDARMSTARKLAGALDVDPVDLVMTWTVFNETRDRQVYAKECSTEEEAREWKSRFMQIAENASSEPEKHVIRVWTEPEV